ncbi:MAG TPA: DUF4377 domain-containing protein [Oligoflexus sp.]|uniref:DUF4377 domain-containing protein n=1 Tax=Oligoflexus sp. TaxID=1971216 RepID=UPI002D69CCA5|nr:DUF4377 domain-containing protein [Oligoflexus sp.]HYX37651.1 DUF4377 domain-containing protein [Oligoflexus sp.]
MKAYGILLFVASCLGSASCSSNKSKSKNDSLGVSEDANSEIIESVQIMPYKAVCQAEGTSLCYIQSEAGQQTLIYGDIEGFEFEWGFQYDIETKRIPIENPPADSGSFYYQLVKTNQKQQIDLPVAFELNFRGNQKKSIATILDASGGNMSLDSHLIECGHTACDELKAYMASVDNCDVSIELTLHLKADKRFAMNQFRMSECASD